MAKRSASQINEALGRIFNEEGRRIVFWNNPQQEFGSIPESLAIDDVNIVRLDEVGALEIKMRIEREDTTGRYLLYSPTEKPEFENDWLLDVRLYSRSFRADRASIILDELGLASQHLERSVAIGCDAPTGPVPTRDINGNSAHLITTVV